MSGAQFQMLLASGGHKIILAFLDNDQSSSTATGFTFSAMSFGAASGDRWIVCCVGWQGSGAARTISSLTIGGVSASQISGVAATNANNIAVDMWIAAVPTETSGDVVVTMSGNTAGCTAALYSLTGACDGTAHDTANSTANNPTGTIDVVANGVAIGVANCVGTTPTWTWTNLTEDCDNQYGAGNSKARSAASDSYDAAASVGVTATSSSTLGSAGGFASFAPI